MARCKPETGHFTLVVKHFLFETGRFRLEMARFKPKTRRFKQGMLHYKLEMGHSRVEMSHFTLEMGRFRPEMGRFNLVIKHFLFETPHFKSGMRRFGPMLRRSNSARSRSACAGRAEALIRTLIRPAPLCDDRPRLRARGVTLASAAGALLVIYLAADLGLVSRPFHGASAFRKASRWEPHTAGSEWVPWPRVSSLVGIST